MGMFSEMNAQRNAKKLEGILLNAMDCDDEIKKFVTNNLYEWYLYECSDAFCKANPVIKEFYEK